MRQRVKGKGRIAECAYARASNNHLKLAATPQFPNFLQHHLILAISTTCGIFKSSHFLQSRYKALPKHWYKTAYITRTEVPFGVGAHYLLALNVPTGSLLWKKQVNMVQLHYPLWLGASTSWPRVCLENHPLGLSTRWRAELRSLSLRLL